MALNRKQVRFVSEYLKDLNASQACLRAGYQTKNPNVVGPRVLAHVGVKAAIAAKQAEQLRHTDLSASRVLEEYRRLAFINRKDFYDADGNLKPVTAWTDEMGAAVADAETVIKNVAAGDRHTDTIHKLKLWDKTRALNDLAKHFALLTEQVQHSGGIELVWRDSE